jgi:hypothetical protein
MEEGDLLPLSCTGLALPGHPHPETEFLSGARTPASSVFFCTGLPPHKIYQLYRIYMDKVK